MTKLKTALIYGVFAGLILNSVWWVFNWLFMDLDNYDMSKGEVAGYVTMLLAFTAVFFGVKKYRDESTSRSISFGNAFLVGIYIVSIASVLYVIGWMIYSDLMMPDFAVQFMNGKLAAMKEAGATMQELEATQLEYESFNEMYKNPLIKALFTFIEPLPVGIVASLISALILKKNRQKVIS